MGLVAGVIGTLLQVRLRPTEELAINQRLDLSYVSVTRGATSSQEPTIHLPRRHNELTILLPFFSDDGQYAVEILSERTKSGAVDVALDKATQTGKATTLKVTFDLTHVKQGVYSLATVHGADQATYYYPIAVRD